MSKKAPVGNQADTIKRGSPFQQLSFDLKRQDEFAKSLGIQFTHYKALPSPIGQKDRGDYRRSDGVDTITSNGMIYRCAGKFTATMTDNTREQRRSEGGIVDPSQSRIVMPRFYDKIAQEDDKRIYLAPGDRLYISDKDADVLVSNYQKMDYEPGLDSVPVFPIEECELVVDSQNNEYVQGTDYTICAGNVRWIDGGKNPGVDPDTGKGRIFSIRYLYKAYWYIVSIPKEVRVTNVTNGITRDPERMAYHAVIVREYVYHNQNKGDEQNQLKSKDPKRAVQAPSVGQKSTPDIVVDMTAIGEEQE